jgi:hypothetical protein
MSRNVVARQNISVDQVLQTFKPAENFLWNTIGSAARELQQKFYAPGDRRHRVAQLVCGDG